MSSSKLNSTLASDILNKLFKSLVISGLLIYIIYISSFHTSSWPSYTSTTNPTKTGFLSLSRPRPLNASHIVFGIAATATTWRNRKHYVESWWQPNTTRGYVFFEKMHPDLHPWPNHTLPPFQISQDISKYRDYDRHKARQAIRMARIITETLELEKKHGGGGARWYFLGDDDTVVFVENLVEVLGKYDDRKMLYVGMNSETHGSNVLFSFEMAFGGGGYALSRPLAEALAANMDVCLKRYPSLYGSDHIVQSCVADLGVSLTKEIGFHQIDLHNDISGFLSAHPQAPLVSLHHLDVVDPIFPSMSRNESLQHLMKAAGADQSRLLQQSICYHKPLNWSFSVSWGYSVHVYESLLPPSLLQRPIQTFSPWTKWAHPHYLFNTRPPSNNPCQAPHLFFFHSLLNHPTTTSSASASGDNYYILTTTYSRGRPRALPPCLPSGNHSAHSISTIILLSPAAKYDVIGNRRECCDVSHGINATEIKLRDCHENEIIPSTHY